MDKQAEGLSLEMGCCFSSPKDYDISNEVPYSTNKQEEVINPTRTKSIIDKEVDDEKDHLRDLERKFEASRKGRELVTRRKTTAVLGSEEVEDNE